MKQYTKDLGRVALVPEGVWSDNKAYDKLSIVYNKCDKFAYVSRKEVPVGVDIDNKEYWQPLNVNGYADNNFINLTKADENNQIIGYENIVEAATSVSVYNRRVGAVLSFYNINSDRLDRQPEFELWQFNSTNVNDWNKESAWQNIYYNWNVFVGWYLGLDALKNHVSEPTVGQYAYIGTTLNDALLVQCRANKIWTVTDTKVRDYISVKVEGNITIGDNGNWFNDGKDTGIPATPSVDEELDSIVSQIKVLKVVAENLHTEDVRIEEKVDANKVKIEEQLNENVKTLDSKINNVNSKLQTQITSNDGDIEKLQTRSTQLEESVKDIAASGGASTANAVSYNNETSKLDAINAQGAIDELQTKKFDKENVVQELGDAEDKVVSQNVVSSLVQINIENSLSGLYNNISIDGNTLTIKKEGFSVICMGKRITFSGSEDKVYTGTGIRTSLYLNPMYLIGKSAVDFTTNDDAFVLKQDSVYNGILFAQWYQSKLMVTGLIAAILNEKQLSDTTGQLEDTAKIQIYMLNNTTPYIEETSLEYVYFRFENGIGVRCAKKDLSVQLNQLMEQLSVEGVTSPLGVANCIEIQNLHCFVFDLNDQTFKIIHRKEVKSYHYIILSNVNGKVSITRNSSIYNQWFADKAANAYNQVNDINKQLSDTNKIQIYCFNNGVPYIEETGVEKVYVKFPNGFGVRCTDSTIHNKSYDMDSLLNEMGISAVTSPKGVEDCLVISSTECFVYDLSEYTFKLVKRDKVTANHVTILSNVFGKISLTKNSSVFSQWLVGKITNNENNINDNVDLFLESRTLNNVAFNSDLRFMYLSDVHASVKNMERIISKANGLGTQYVDCILNGGDVVNSWNTQGYDWYNQLVESSSLPILTAVGNHDAWSSNYWVWDTAENIYNLVTKKVKEYVPSIVQPSDVDTSFANYYYYDTDKVRIIILLSLCQKSGSDIYYDDAQDNWLKTVLADAKINNKAVIVMNHGPIDPKDSNEFDSNWSSKFTWTKDTNDTQHLDDRILQAVDEFINDGGTFICYLAGHSHVDYLLRSKNHPKQMCLVIASARYNYSFDCKKSGNESNKDYDLYNYIGIDLTHSIIKVMRIGCNNNAWMQEHNTLCLDFKNCKILSEH